MAVIGQTSSKGKKPCELWFLVADKKSSSSEAFIEGRYLYEVGRRDGSETHEEFELHTDDEPVRLAKASVIDIVKDCNCRDGVYSIARSTIAFLETIVDFEDDSDGKGLNRRIATDTKSVEISGVPDRGQLLAALSNAKEWKDKVIYISQYLQVPIDDHITRGQTD